MRQVVAINDRCTISYYVRRTIVRSIVATDRTINRDGRRPIVRSIVATDHTINRDGRRPVVRSIVASGDRSYEQSWHPAYDGSYEQSWHPVTECTINCGTQRPIADQSWGKQSIARSIVASFDRSLRPTTHCTINRDNRGTKRPIIRSIVASCDRSYDQSCDYRSATIHNWSCHHARLVVRSRKTYLRPLTIWNRRLEVLNMTIDLVTHFALPIIHDLRDQSCIRSTIYPRF